MLFDVQTAVEALDDLLDFERRQILDGKYDTLSRTSHKKLMLVTRLNHENDTATLDRVRKKAARNQELLGAAARGIEAAKLRLRQMSEPGQTLRTYGANGTATVLAPTPPKQGVNHRA